MGFTAFRHHHTRFIAFCAVLGIVFAATIGVLRPEEAFILGFDVGAVVFIASVIPLWAYGTPKAPKPVPSDAEDDDGGRLLLPFVALMALLAVLVAVVRMMSARSSLTGLDAGAIAGTLVLAWLFANLVVAFHYDRVAGRDPKAIEFPGTAAPAFSDYVYFSFIIGMTCQTADAAIGSPRLRKLATLHGIVVFFFNLGVLALTVNVLSGVL
ncbi:DUF1345 domain-containing protein [Falsirhodobacter halotolerans]|uniref:DUF1345 domain-containing protein n=1 Tax=Falsirhodobacter halotolerans TaxID=1146892 RepID=UPI001FD33162|nr:DUF1345 domain-containing protein [Falsirhodobacter halotolerans]MCJ8141195.1 DUF1345 domain-containing protein [Falsirhodobacter halotolerans]